MECRRVLAGGTPSVLLQGNIMNVREWVQYGLSEAGFPNLTITVEWSNRFTARLGDANYFPDKGYGRIRLSSKLWPTMSEEEQIDTVLHEVAHVVDFYCNGKVKVRGKQNGGHHGPTWKAICKKIGAKAKRYAGNDVADFAQFRRRVVRYSVPCHCDKPHIVTKHRLTKMRNGATYRCRRCGHILKGWKAVEV